MIGRILRFILLFALAAWLLKRFLNRAKQAGFHDTVKNTAWLLLGMAVATLFWYLMMLYFKQIPDAY